MTRTHQLDRIIGKAESLTCPRCRIVAIQLTDGPDMCPICGDRLPHAVTIEFTVDQGGDA